jgi:hypothetical protein
MNILLVSLSSVSALPICTSLSPYSAAVSMTLPPS